MTLEIQLLVGDMYICFRNFARVDFSFFPIDLSNKPNDIQIQLLSTFMPNIYNGETTHY